MTSIPTGAASGIRQTLQIPARDHLSKKGVVSGPPSSQSFPSQLRQPVTDTFSRTLFVSNSGLENAKRLVSSYKQGSVRSMTPELWQAKKVVDSTLHPGTNGFLE
ncbi:MAG: hypothetical protein M1812_002388 [Candelaria pacifica]|nr:MAG: hypothetical protein M1812_002388 [Candelaria pacifica]